MLKKVSFIFFKCQRFYQMVSSISIFFHMRWYFLRTEIRYNKWCNSALVTSSRKKFLNVVDPTYHCVNIFFLQEDFTAGQMLLKVLRSKPKNDQIMCNAACLVGNLATSSEDQVCYRIILFWQAMCSVTGRSWSYCSWIYNYLCNQCLSSLSCEFEPRSWRGVLDTALCDKVYLWLATGQWVSSTNKIDHHDITEILLKVINQCVLWQLLKFWSTGTFKWILSYSPICFYWSWCNTLKLLSLIIVSFCIVVNYSLFTCLTSK